MKILLLALILTAASGFRSAAALEPGDWEDPVPAPTLRRPLLIESTPAPQVATLTPFSAAADYMSLPGYYRYVTYENTGVWLSRDEAVAYTSAQLEAAGR